MSRPLKDGLDYFPFDVKMDEKFKALETLHKNDGFVWLVKFWQQAYSRNDGLVDLNGIFGIIHAENCRITIQKQNDIIADCIKIGIIIQQNDGIYTSNGIQKRLQIVNKLRINERERKFSNSFPNGKPYTKGGKESKVKESKVNNTIEHDILKKQTSAFEIAWKEYPRRLGKKQAFKHYCATVNTKEDAQACLEAIDNYKYYLEKNKTEERYIKHGATFFNNWRDYVQNDEENAI
jgi:hypothetical protein